MCNLRRFLLLASAAVAMSAATARGEDARPRNPVPKDAALLEIAAPVGTQVTIDGKDATGQSEFRCEFGKPDDRDSNIEAKFPDGTQKTERIHIHRGSRLPIYLRPESFRSPAVGATGGLFFSGGVKFSPDGRHILSCGIPAILWDVKTGEQIRTFPKRELDGDLTFSPDGGLLLLSHCIGKFPAFTGAAAVHNVKTGDKAFGFATKSGWFIYSAFTPDGRHVLYASDRDGVAALYDIPAGKITQPYAPTYIKAGKTEPEPAIKYARSFDSGGVEIESIAVSPDGRQVAGGLIDGTAVIWDAATGKILRTLHLRHPERALPRIFHMAFSPDSKRVLTVSGEGVDIWDAATGGRLRTFLPDIWVSDNNVGDCISSAEFSPNGRQLLTGLLNLREPSPGVMRGEVCLWDLATGEKIRSFGDDVDHPNSGALSPDGTLVVTNSARCPAVLWDVKTGRKLRSFGTNTDPINSLALSADGSRLLAGSSHAAIEWDLQKGAVARSFGGPKHEIYSAALSPDGGQVVAGLAEKVAVVWDEKTGKEIRKLAGHSGIVEAAAFSPDGRQIVTGSDDYTAILWDAATGQPAHPLKGHTQPVYSAVFSPDGGSVLTGSFDKTAILWDAASGERILSFAGHDDWVRAVAFSPDGHKALTGSYDGTAILWNIRTGEKIRTFTGPHEGLASLAFSADGRQVLAGAQDHTAILWDTRTGQKLRTFAGHSETVSSVAFASDDRVLTASEDGTTRLWSIATGQELGQLISFDRGTEWLVISPDGVFDGSRLARLKYMRFRNRTNPLKIVRPDEGFAEYYHPNLLSDILAGDAIAPAPQKPAPGKQ